MGALTQEQRKAETRARLINAAAELFARKGFHAVSAEAVADAADRTTGALYSHFGGKDGLLLALVERWLDESATRIAAIVESATDLDGRLRALWCGFIAPHEEHGDAWLLLEFELWLHAVREPMVADRLAERYATYRAALEPPLRQWARDAGLGRLRRPDRVATNVIALLLGLAMQHRIDPSAVSDDLAVDALRSTIQGACR
jgi:AcrR family transcriptional regulator